MSRNTLLLVALTALMGAAAAAQDAEPGAESTESPRDLFRSHQSPAGGGKPGTMIHFELLRDGRTTRVPPTAEFRSGDQVRIHFATNFDGFIAIINRGTSGRSALLFPHGPESNRVRPTGNYLFPSKPGYFRFDHRPGRERLVFIMAKRQIPELLRIPGLSGIQPSDATSAPPPSGGSSGGLASGAEEAEILAALNSRVLGALARGSSRDLVLQTTGDAGFALTSNEDLSEPIALELTLIHR